MKKIITLLLILFILPIAILSGCDCNKKLDTNFNNFIGDKDKIIVKTDSMLKADIEKYLENLNQEAIFPIEVVTQAENPDLIITTDKNLINKDWNKEELFKLFKGLKPESFSQKFSDNINDFVIYLGKPDSVKNNEIVANYLKQSFADNPPKTLTIILVGDIMLSRTVAKKIGQYGFDYPFSQIKDYLKQADLTIGNLESPASEKGPYQTQSGTMVFRHDPQNTAYLKNAGFDLFSLANNHFGNAGLVGMEFTMKNLADNELGYFGAGENQEKSHQALIKEINGIKFAFLGYSDSSVTPASYAATDKKAGLNLDNIDKMKDDVKNAKDQADYVIVSMHLGTEYQNKPNQKQINFAKTAIESGADFIYGHHPHVIQSIDFYNGKPIFYSLGNFIFDQNQKNTQQGMVVNAKFIYNKLVGLELKSVNIKNYSQPNWEDESALSNVLNRIQ